MSKRRQHKQTLFYLILIALMAALGIGAKPLIGTLAHLVTGPLAIPGGAMAGGIYMLFLVLAASLTGVRGAGTLCGFLQGLLAMVTGFGSHGAMSPLTYTLPGLAADLAFLLLARREVGLPACFLAGMLANIAGTVSVNYVFFSMPWLFLLLSLFAAGFSGGLGGVIAWNVTKKVKRWNVLK